MLTTSALQKADFTRIYYNTLLLAIESITIFVLNCKNSVSFKNARTYKPLLGNLCIVFLLVL